MNELWQDRRITWILRIVGIIMCLQPVLLPAGIQEWEQDVTWRHLTSYDGLSADDILFVTPGFKDKIWITHEFSEFASGTDGYVFEQISMPDDRHYRIYESRTGQLWTTNSRDVLLYRNGRWDYLSLPASPSFPDSEILGILPAEYNHVLVLYADRLVDFDVINNDLYILTIPDSDSIGPFIDIRLARDQGAWILGKKGLVRIAPPIRNLARNVSVQTLPLPADSTFLFTTQFFEIEPNVPLVVARSISGESPHSLMRFDGSHWSTAIDHFWGWEQIIPKTNRQAIINGQKIEADKEKFFRSEYEEPVIADIACLNDGSFILGRSDGLFKETEKVWKKVYESPAIEFLDYSLNDATFLVLDQDGIVRIGPDPTDSMIISAFPGNWPAGSITSTNQINIRKLSTDQFWIQNSQLSWTYSMSRNEWRETGLPPLQSADAKRYPDTPSVNPTRDFSQLWIEQTPARTSIFGQTYLASPQYITDMMDLWPEMPEIHDIAQTPSRDSIWIATSVGVALYNGVSWQTFDYQLAGIPPPVNSIHLPLRGKPLFACQNGLFEFDGRSIVRSLESSDPILHVLEGRNGNLWAHSGKELFRYMESSWIQYAQPEDLISNTIFALFEDERRQIWVSTDEGIYVYVPSADYDYPETSFFLAPPEMTLDKTGLVSTTLSGVDKWKHTFSHRLLFSYQIDGHEWSPFRNNRTLFLNNLNQGNHTILVRAMDRNGNVDISPARWEFNLIIPWYTDLRMVTMVAITSISLLFLIWLALDRHMSLQRSYRKVEQIVQERTHQLEEANKQLLMHQKMRAMGALASGVAHDFNSILSIVQGSAQIIKSNLHNPEKIKTRIDRIETVVRQGSSLVRAMLGFARDRNLPLTPLNIPVVLNSVLEILNDRIPAHVKIRMSCPPSLPMANGNHEFLQQILINLLLNAFDAMDNAGQIEILATTQPVLEHELHILALHPASADNYIHLYIKDFGCGMSQSIQERIFEPFFTTKALSTKKGTGLGLSMVYELAQQMGYGLAVGSVPDKYSLFDVKIPVTGQTNPVPH